MDITDITSENYMSFLKEKPVNIIVFMAGDEFDCEQIFSEFWRAANYCPINVGFGCVDSGSARNLGICRANGVSLTPMVKYFVKGVSVGFDRIGADAIHRGLQLNVLTRDVNDMARICGEEFFT